MSLEQTDYDEKNIDGVSIENATLKETLRKYVDTVGDRKDDVASELQKFVRWLGEKRKTTSILPSEIGEFSDTHYERSSTPDYKHLREVREFLSFLRRKRYITVSLAHHVRVARSGRFDASKSEPRINRNRKKIRLTRDGHHQLVSELGGLKNEQIKISEDIKRAAADGDIRENAPLDAAREEQSRIVSKVTEIENILKFATIIVPNKNRSSDKVRVGSKVKVSSTALKKDTEYQIVSSNESNPNKGKISAQSPVGQALIDGRVGNKIEVTTPSGTKLSYTIKSIN